jgi:superfamily II DNA or RNA helicase
VELRPYQKECVKRVLDAYEKDRHGYEIVVLPTGSGKTVIASFIIHELQKRHGINVLFIDRHKQEIEQRKAAKTAKKEALHA